MGIFDRFPYSSTHEMNLDFMLGKATEIAESLQTVQDGLSDIDTHKAQAEQAAQAAQASQAAASASAGQAAQHVTNAEDAADRAEAAATEAETAADRAETALGNITNAETVCTEAAEEAQQYAEASQTHSGQAQIYKNAAEAAKNSAELNASQAATSAGSAANSATDAASSANTANVSATNASLQASNAATSATNAATSATNAATNATNAAASANSAAESKEQIDALVESLPQDFTDLNNTVNQLSDEIDGIEEDVSILITTAPADTEIRWENGRIDASGIPGTLNTRIRTIDFFGVFNHVNGIDGGTDYTMTISAYDASEQFIGTWNGSGFGTSSYWFATFDCTAFPTYKFKATVRKGDGSAVLTPADGDNITFTYADVRSANTIFLHPSKNIGYAWEVNGINLDNGTDQAVNTRKRTQYIPVEEGKTYAFNVSESNNAYAEYVFYYTADKTPILIDTENNRYYTRFSSGFFPKSLTIPTGFDVAYIRMMVTTTNFDTYRSQAELGTISTTFRASDLKEPDNTLFPNNVRGYIGKNVMLFGDSITAQNNWSEWFRASVKPENFYNYAVGGAKWCDDTAGVVYDGTASPNVIGNQVQKAINNNIQNIDCVIILAGTNDTNVTFPSDADIETAFFDGSMNAIDLANVDKTTWQGAMRWSLENLILRYPNAKIFVCSPVQRMCKSAEPVLSLYSTIKSKGETICKMAKRMGVEFVDTEQCGISACRSSDFADGLHPWQRTSEKIARYIIARYMAHFNQY